MIGINFNEAEEIESVSDELRSNINEATTFFARHQIDMINFNLASFSKLTQQQRVKLSILKKFSFFQLAIEIKKREVKSTLIDRISILLNNNMMCKPFLRKLELNNHWQQAAWQSAKIKCNDYEEYRLKV